MKKRPTSHVTDSAGTQLFRSVLPQEWVVREYQPDYGIDFSVEVFDSQGGEFVTLGEHFFVQLKSHSKAQWVSKEVHPRYNVEKMPLEYDRKESSSIRVIAETLDTAELQLARWMGAASPLVLVVADTSHSQVHWVCLNDFVDKVLVPEAGGSLSLQASHTVHLPEFNCIELTDSALIPLRFLARRGKFYSAFNRFRYQRHEIQDALHRWEIEMEVDRQIADTDLLRLANHFLGAVLAYDFWKTTRAWPAVELTHMYASATASVVAQALEGQSLEAILAHRLKGGVAEELPDHVLRSLFVSDIGSTFDRLANLGNMFEEVCREWFLPTYLGMLAEQHAIR